MVRKSHVQKGLGPRGSERMEKRRGKRGVMGCAVRLLKKGEWITLSPGNAPKVPPEPENLDG